MRSATERLLREIRLGEDSFLELKEVFFSGEKVKAPTRKALADELSAFANSRGGVLILGIHDRSREVVGIPESRLDAVVTQVREAARDLVIPPLDVVVERMEVPDTGGGVQCIVRVSVGRSLFVHRSPGGYLKRVADEKREITPDALRRLFQQRSHVGVTRFDGEIVAAASFSDLDPERVRRFRTEATDDDEETLASKLGMTREDETGVRRPTVGGLLLGSRSAERWMPNTFVQAVAYRGRFVGDGSGNENYQLDFRDIRGPLDVQVADACRFVARNQRVAAEKTIGRRDIPQYHLGAVFEAMVNAVAHRDYSVYGSKIRLRMFSDRLELFSPGEMPNTMTVDALPYKQISRNETITSLLARCPVPKGIPGLTTPRKTLMDRRGEGVGLILRESEEHSGRRPVYELLDGTELRLTIYGADGKRGTA